MKALVPCHSSTPKSASKSSVSVYQGMSQPIRAFKRSMFSCGRARDEHEGGVAGVQMGEVGDLVGEEGAAAAAALGPALHARARRRSGRRPAAGAPRTGRAGWRDRPGPRSVLLVHGHPRHPAALGGQRIAGAGQLLLLHQQLRAGGLPFLRRHDWRGVHCGLFLLEVFVDDVEQAPPQGALAIHPVGRLAEHAGLEREPVRPALDHARDDARLLQDLQVLGDRGLGHAEAAGGFDRRSPGLRPGARRCRGGSGETEP